MRIGILLLSFLCLFAQEAEAKINRKALLQRNSPVVHSFDSLSSLSVGNGGFAVTVDATGLQTFPTHYSKGVPLGTQSDWGWHSFANPKGYKPEDEPIIMGGDAAYFSTLPVRKIADAISKEGIPSRVSYSAGAYVCNDVLYTLLSHYKNRKTKIGFIHIPYSKEQNKEPSMDLSLMTKGLTAVIENIDA
jgi:hypothetical protein